VGCSAIRGNRVTCAVDTGRSAVQFTRSRNSRAIGIALRLILGDVIRVMSIAKPAIPNNMTAATAETSNAIPRLRELLIGGP